MFLVSALAFGKSARAMRICFSFAKAPVVNERLLGGSICSILRKG
jgi:hypothetical protein